MAESSFASFFTRPEYRVAASFMLTAVGRADTKYSNWFVTNVASSSTLSKPLLNSSTAKLKQPTMAMAGAPRTYKVQKNIAFRAPDKVHIFISIMPISSPKPDHLYESSHREEITQVESIEINFTHYLELCII